MQGRRTSWQVTRSVWFALFMREASTRIMSNRMGAFWVLAEPIAMIGIMLAIRGAFLGKSRFIPGAEFVPWMAIGLMTFFMMRDLMLRPMEAVSANKALFAYRQVTPIDTVLSRAYVESALSSFILLFFVFFLIQLGFNANPHAPLYAFMFWVLACLFGLGLGLVASVLIGLVPEIGKLIRMLSFPLMLMSGALFPIASLPEPILKFMLFNPMVHIIEYMRSSFFEHYHLCTGVSIHYFFNWAFGLLLVGVILHIRFAVKLKRQ